VRASRPREHAHILKPGRIARAAVERVKESAAVFRNLCECMRFPADILQSDAVAGFELQLNELERAVRRVKQRIEAPAACNLVEIQFTEELERAQRGVLGGTGNKKEAEFWEKGAVFLTWRGGDLKINRHERERRRRGIDVP
jgi:hypothetical protein